MRAVIVTVNYLFLAAFAKPFVANNLFSYNIKPIFVLDYLRCPLFWLCGWDCIDCLNDFWQIQFPFFAKFIPFTVLSFFDKRIKYRLSAYSLLGIK